MKKISVIGFIVVGVLGALFHFAYEYVPLFIFPRNESIFEHTKLIIFPMLFYYLGLLFIRKIDKKRLFSSFITAILLGIGIIVVGYYTYSGIIGDNIDFINISLYYVAILCGFIVIYKEKTLNLWVITL